MDALYTLIDCNGALELRVITTDAKTIPHQFYLSRTGTGLLETVLEILNGTDSASKFKLAIYLVLIMNEDLQALGKRMANPKTRNIHNSSATCFGLLYKKLRTKKSAYKSKSEGERKLFLNENFRKSLDALCKESGLAVLTDIQQSYKITNDVLSRTCTPEIERYLAGYAGGRQCIFNADLELIKEHLEKEAPDESKDIVKEIEKTACRDPLAVTSLRETDGHLWVSIVNKDKQLLTVESHKFMQLIEAKESLCIHRFSKKYQANNDDIFELSGAGKGFVYGRFDNAKSCLQVVALEEGNKNPYQRCVFIIDPQYLICLYTTLERIDEDRERFLSLQRETDLHPLPFDPFEELPKII